MRSYLTPSKGLSSMALAMFICSLFILFGLIGCNEKGNQPQGAMMDFDTNSYIEYSSSLRQPQHFEDDFKEQYVGYNPSVLQIIDYYSENGLEDALLILFDRLAHSEDPRELLEINNALFFQGAHLPFLLFKDPQLVIETFDQERYKNGNEEELAAAEYLIALAYSRGFFDKAVLSDEEYQALAGSLDVDTRRELEKQKEDSQRAIKENGLLRLEHIYEEYPNSRISQLARSDYIIDQIYNKKIELDICEDELQTAMSNFPDTVFVTNAYMRLGAYYIDKKDADKAEYCYMQALSFPDFMSTMPGKTTHERAEEIIQSLEKHP